MIKNPNYKHGKYSKKEKERRSIEWKNKTHEEKYAHLIGKDPWNKGIKTGPNPHTPEHIKHISEANRDKEGRMVVCEGVLYNNLRQAADVYDVSVQAMINRINSTTERFSEFHDYNEDDFDIYYLYDEENIKEYRDKSLIYNSSTRERLVSCEGIVMTLTEATKYYGFKSKNSIVSRCNSNNFNDFYFVE